jgi:hypothetical protein
LKQSAPTGIVFLQVKCFLATHNAGKGKEREGKGREGKGREGENKI